MLKRNECKRATNWSVRYWPKADITFITVVFEISGDPAQLGLRGRGNVTGVTQLSAAVAPMRLELLHELVPTASAIALLVNPANPALAEADTRDLRATAHRLGLKLHVLNATSDRDFDAVFANLIQSRAGGLVIGSDPFFVARQEQLAALAVRYAVPTAFQNREFVAAGGLISYGGSITDAYRQAGVYVARILKGEKPHDLPVQQGTKVEQYINRKSAKALGLNVPNTLIGHTDEVIE